MRMTTMLKKEGRVVDKDLKETLAHGDYKSLKHAEEKLLKWDTEYRERKGRKWITMIIGTILFAIIGWIVMPLTNKLKHSLYDRRGLAGVTETKFGETRMNEVLTDEVMIVAYDFRNHVPVIFTKYAATQPDTK
jgi:hypothetical protein